MSGFKLRRCLRGPNIEVGVRYDALESRQKAPLWPSLELTQLNQPHHLTTLPSTINFPSNRDYARKFLISLLSPKRIQNLTIPGIQQHIQPGLLRAHDRADRQLPTPPSPHENSRTGLHSPPRCLTPSSPIPRTRFRELRCVG
jgi:hypothetical protein